jgi:hypothetical protein
MRKRPSPRVILSIVRRHALAVILFLALFPAGAAHARVTTDLDVGWISRQPEIAYVWNSTNPRVEGWPAPGESVTWRAHVRNWSTTPRNVSYQWLLDGQVVASGTMAFAADSFTTVDFQWPWTFERHQLTFVVDSSHLLSEESEANNTLAVFTDALAVGFWVEESFYRLMRENQHRLAGVGSASFEDWAQRHMTRFNAMAETAIYPETPRGVLDRWRIQKIVVVPDGGLPVSPIETGDQYDATGATHPHDADRSVDMSWGFPASHVDFYDGNLTFVSDENLFYLAGFLIHELGHARYLIDTYAYRVHHTPPVRTVEITENGKLVVGTALMPATASISNGVKGFIAFTSPDNGLMGTSYGNIDRHSAVAMNLIAGARAVSGHANVPQNYAVYLNDLPAENRITIVDARGKPVPHAQVDFFQAVRWDDNDFYSARYDDLPDLHFVTDAKGQILVGRNPFTPRGTLSGLHLGELVAIVRVRAGGKTAFGYLESRVFNLAYWRGERELADHKLKLETLEQMFRRRGARKP